MTPKDAATRLLELAAKIGPELREIEDCKELLKAEAKRTGSFQVRVDGKGLVEVKAPAPGRLTGILPGLDPELFLALTEEEKKPLLDSKIVVMMEQRTRPFSGSVTYKVD